MGKYNNRIQVLMITALASTAMNVTADDTTQVPAEWSAVQYNDGVRYSQWVINSRISDFRANAKDRGFNTYDQEGHLIGTSLGPSAFDYVPGLVAKAIIEAAGYYSNQPWARPWYYSIESYANSCYQEAPSTGRSQDDMNAAKMYFPLRELAMSAYKEFADPKTVSNAEYAIGNIALAFGDLNRTYVITDSILPGAAGGWWHKGNYVDQMWCDGLYMGSALLSQLVNYQKAGYVTGTSATDWDLITKQFDISWKYLWDADKQLLWHAFTANPGDEASKDWAGIGYQTLPDGSRAIVYHSAAYWGRACGWYFLALDDILEQMQIAHQEQTANYQRLQYYLQTLADGLMRRQDPRTGTWYQLLDEDASFVATQYRGETYPATPNYLESSCSSIFAAAYFKGIRLGVLDRSKYEAMAKRAYQGCVNEFMMQQPDGSVQLIHNCASAGLGNLDMRDASKEYYLLGPDVPQRNTYTEGKVLGGFVLAATEYERLYQTDKEVMLSADLLPHYKLHQPLRVAADTRDAAQNISYQWYYAKNKKAQSKGLFKPLSDRTSQIKPTKSGYYYCIVTTGTTSVKTSVTKVGR